jgi:hypothetical protein
MRYQSGCRDRGFCVALGAIGLLGLATFSLFPFLEETLARNGRTCADVLPNIMPVARNMITWVPCLAFAGVVPYWYGLRRLTTACYGVLAGALVFYTFKSLVAMAPLLSDKAAGDYVRSHAKPGDLVVMEGLEEFEYVSSFAFYADRRVLMVKRGVLPQFPIPVPPNENFLITPGQFHELWHGSLPVFILTDALAPQDHYTKEGKAVVLDHGKKLLVNHGVPVSEYAASPPRQNPGDTTLNSCSLHHSLPQSILQI